MQEEGPPSGWRPEELRPSNQRKPRGGEGARPAGEGGARDLSITESAGGSTYPTKAPASRRGSRRMAAVAAAAREEAVPRARAQSAAAAAESGSGPSRRTRTESSGSRAAT